MASLKFGRFWTATLAATALLAMGGVAATGCAEGKVVTETDDGSGASGGGSSTTTNSGGGSVGGAGGMAGNGGAGGEALPCGIDCSTIETNQCNEAICNLDTLKCEVINVVDATPCDDDVFCTVNDACSAGECIGGPPNDCGLTPATCELVACDEASKSCTSSAAPDGDPCTDPNDLCQVNTSCQNGLCMGDLKDCFFSPVPDDCHVSECNPMNGMCEPVIGNEGLDCTDANDLCTDNKTCTMGVCGGGNPKDCSALTVGCNNGVCDTMSGQCQTQPVPAGGACAEGDSDCTAGFCDMNGMCIPTPANEGLACNDLDGCTVGEVCQTGSCANGTPVTQCVNADGCCPAGCDETNDDDCGCNINHALTAVASHSGGGSGTYGPGQWNDGIGQSGCSGFGWLSNSSSPGGKFMQYDFPSAVQIGSMLLDTNNCSECNGRNLAGAVVQFWDGTTWITATTVTGHDGDLALTFVPKLNTTKLRLFDVAAGTCGQGSNTLAYEWYVWSGSNCQP